MRFARAANRLRGERGELYATCQTGVKLLADRALSQLLRGDWPKILEEVEERKGSGRA